MPGHGQSIFLLNQLNLKKELSCEVYADVRISNQLITEFYGDDESCLALFFFISLYLLLNLTGVHLLITR